MFFFYKLIIFKTSFLIFPTHTTDKIIKLFKLEKNDDVFHTFFSDKDLKGDVLNQAFPSLNEGSLEITSSVTLNLKTKNWFYIQSVVLYSNIKPYNSS